MAVLLWQRDGKRGYQFSDGRQRVFKEGFYHLFKPAVAPGDGSAKTVVRLARLAGDEQVLDSGRRLPSLRDQIGLFREDYPEGFHGEAWQADHRGLGAKRRLKRHRDPAIAQAVGLSRAKLGALVEAKDWAGIHERVHELLKGSDLVPAPHAKRFAALAPSAELGEALYGWLYGEEEGPTRFARFERALGRKVSTWPVISAIGALVDPEGHTCVRPSVYRVQAKMLLPNFQVSARPNWLSYSRYLHMASTVYDELEAAGLAPNDLLDVYDFIWHTLRPAAQARLGVDAKAAPARKTG
ncbi:hypothetical protein G6O69_32405 [Pseudenhygromyxa sp. WMMC2535]|uniref:hypothetical protein n=1 Tax=Pseudenhygromyxa sp. WMMC2535 TaxID=2712867 RepID=UPI0015574542|nr:hypothetical protein [Pseudenhygromyxa sp. WMMC2535]NVB42571.1 hypothetical protein [Pseudenhygromyxa sp. WMMC2535]